MDNSNFEKLTSIINSTSNKVFELEYMYTEYIKTLISFLSDKTIEFELETVIFDGFKYHTIMINSIYFNEETSEISISTENPLFKNILWNDLNIFAMDQVINYIHIALDTELAIAQNNQI